MEHSYRPDKSLQIDDESHEYSRGDTHSVDKESFFCDQEEEAMFCWVVFA